MLQYGKRPTAFLTAQGELKRHFPEGLHWEGDSLLDLTPEPG